MAKKDRERYERDKERYEKENKEKENKKKESNKRTLEYSDDFINEILKKSKNEKSMKQSTSKASSKDLLYLSKLTKDEIKVNFFFLYTYNKLFRLKFLNKEVIFVQMIKKIY